MARLPVTSISGRSNKREIPVGNFQAVENLKNSRLMFSLELLDLNHEYFNLGGTCQRWFVTMFRKLGEASNIPFGELVAGYHRTFRFHPHEPEKISVQIPVDVEQSQTRQLRFGKTYGGIHGVLIDNMFYVVWFDPHHNLYPSKRHGGIKTFVEEEDCCGYNEGLIKSLQEEIDLLEGEVRAAEELLEEKAKEEVASVRGSKED